MTETAVETPLVTIIRRTLHARRFWTAFALVMVVTVAIWAPFRIDHWLTHDDGLFMPTDPPYDGVGESGPVSVGHTFYLGIGPFPANLSTPDATHRVDMRNVTPVTLQNTSDANISILLCHDTGSNLGNLGGGGSTIDDVQRFCSDLRPFTPGTADFGVSRTSLIIAITPHRKGEVHVAGADIRYRHGVRSGHANLPVKVLLTTP